jgi:hypothetical protein
MCAPPERQQQLRDAIWDRACGFRWWAGDNKKPGGKDIGTVERQVRVTDLVTGEEITGWVYEVPGAPDSQKLLVEHGIGRPAVRETVKVDPVIQLIHRVPGKRDWKTQPQQVPEVAAVATEEEAGEGSLYCVADLAPSPEVPGVLMIGGEAFGIGALFPPEPEDEPGEDQ